MVNSFDCLPKCSGVILSSFSKSASEKDFEHLIPEEIEAHNRYTNWYQLPAGLKGR